MASSSGSSRLPTPAIGDRAHQPSSFHFPHREFGKASVVKRSFQRKWFERWSWLHYDEDRDLAFCFVCVVAYQKNLLQSAHCFEQAFISTGFSNWKDAIAKFSKHEVSRCHKDSMLKTITLPATTRDVGELLSLQIAKERLERRKCLLKLLSNARFLARQGLPFRGDGEERCDSNFVRLIHLRAEDDDKLVDWIHRKADKYTSGDIQNEMVKLMALRVLRQIAARLQKTSFFAVMADETTDLSNVEQVVVCLRWVSEKFEVEEDFVGLYEVASTGAEVIYGVITDVLLRLNLSISKVRGQCYDGAATMSGRKSGVVTRLCAAEPRAVFTHCYGHSLNLACSDAIKQCKLMQDALDTTHEITKLIKKSPARDAIFKRLKEEMASDAPGIRVLCPTRWTVRAEALKSILDNYNVLLELWVESLERVKDTEMKARVQGVAAQMMKFDYFFGVSLGLLILRHSDNLSKTMQKAHISAVEAQAVAAMTVSTLKSLRNCANFELFWKKVTSSAGDLPIDEPTLPRRRKLPRRFDDGCAPTFHVTVEDHYRVIYFEALDLITSRIDDRFNQPGYQTYAKVESLLLKAAAAQEYEEELEFVLSFYGSDFDALLLPTQLEIFSRNFHEEREVMVSDIITFFRSCTPGQLEVMSQVSKLVRLLLVMPATNATSERSFSALRRIKTHLRSSMSQQRLNHLTLLHIHKNCIEALNLVDVANDFIAGNEHRKHVFGTEFKPSDLV